MRYAGEIYDFIWVSFETMTYNPRIEEKKITS